ncbi:thiolase C-terminal domain-containing protein [Methanolobus psychrotolerans]|uniref:thiolase C-terminal domain-containing protein n=1 Tax=Methanolobus psychrotolerans TaxID=1874706 RepID=UPI000B91CB2C|nr:hypothetical protein [Methanolobus psychrotolerans]
MYISGIGRTEFGFSKQSLPQLIYKAIYEAIKDSPISIEQIDAIFVSNFLSGLCDNQLHLNSIVSSLLPELKIPIIRIETACSSGATALYQSLISMPHYRNVLVVGVEKMTHVDNIKLTGHIASASDRTLDQEQGLIFPANYALIAQQHFQRYNSTHEDLVLISYKNHQNANLNPLAHFNYKKVTMEMIENAPLVAAPLTLFDCSPISDGAAALVISDKRTSSRDIEIIGMGIGTDFISLSQRKELTSFEATKIAAKKAYDMAKVGPEDINVAELHDCFTISELISMEDLGFCKPGEGKYLVREKRTMIKGDIPINTDGGLKANGHPMGASGISQVYEIVMQLRKEAGKRQVQNANLGLSHSLGGIGGTSVVHIFRGE